MKNPITRPAIIFLAALSALIIGTGCSTVRGVGKDVGKVGDHIEDSTR